ncbi:MAG: hypothetical protein WEB00_15075 [Dehalococcoidia bacterium]
MAAAVVERAQALLKAGAGLRSLLLPAIVEAHGEDCDGDAGAEEKYVQQPPMKR